MSRPKIDVNIENMRAIMVKRGTRSEKKTPFEALILEVSPSGKYIRIEDSPSKNYSDDKKTRYKDDVMVKNASWHPIEDFADIETIGQVSKEDMKSIGQ